MADAATCPACGTTQPGWQNVPATQIMSAGICGVHGCYVGKVCPKCVTTVKP